MNLAQGEDELKQYKQAIILFNAYGLMNLVKIDGFSFLLFISTEDRDVTI